MVKVTLPIYGVAKGAISLNWYRNAHYQVSNSAKKKFKRMILDQLNELPVFDGKISIHYDYYAKANNSPDLDNFIAVAKKFFQDALVECGKLEDDNVNFIVSNSESYKGIDKKAPRVEAFIELNL